MQQRTYRFLMLWSFIVLQAMTPFIHAHAGAVLDHSGPMHLHEAAHHAAAWHAIGNEEHGVEVAVEPGVRLRTLDATPADASPAVALALPPLEPARCPGIGLSAPPLPAPTLRDHILPHALAPPAA